MQAPTPHDASPVAVECSCGRVLPAVIQRLDALEALVRKEHTETLDSHHGWLLRHDGEIDDLRLSIAAIVRTVNEVHSSQRRIENLLTRERLPVEKVLDLMQRLGNRLPPDPDPTPPRGT